MADTFGVTHADVGAQVPALFPLGFDDTSKPTRGLVQQWISTADTIATMAITAAAREIPADDSPAAGIARQYVINYTLSYVMRALYAGQDPLAVKTAADQFGAPAADLLAQLEAFATLDAGSGSLPPSRFRGPTDLLGAVPQRELLIQDTQLDGSAFREKKY